MAWYDWFNPVKHYESLRDLPAVLTAIADMETKEQQALHQISELIKSMGNDSWDVREIMNPVIKEKSIHRRKKLVFAILSDPRYGWDKNPQFEKQIADIRQSVENLYNALIKATKKAQKEEKQMLRP